MGKTTIERARESRRKHYYANKEAHYQRNKVTKDRIKDFINECKTSCQVCGESEKICLDFHHLRDKDMPVSQLAAYGSMKRVKEEIDKCIVLCSNCHRKVHAGIINTDVVQLVEL